MSPEERAVADVVMRAEGRARWLAAAEAAAIGAVVAVASRPAGLITAVVWAVWRSRTASRASIAKTLERALPAARNLFVTADELSAGTLAVKPAVRQRVFAHAAARAREVDLRQAFPMARASRATLVAAGVWLIVAGASLWRGPLANMGAANGSAAKPAQAAAAVSSSLHVSVTVQPPAYTGLPPATVADPPQIQAVEGSTVTLSIDARATSVTLDHDGQTRSPAPGAAGRFSDRIQVTHTGYVLVAAANGARRLMPIVVSPDALPSVKVVAPGRDLVYAGGNPRIAFDARATDDFGLRSLALHYTKVSGSGEQFEFQEGEIPLAVTRATAREWQGIAVRALADLTLKEGDMLVYRAVATDARPGDGSASSDAFFIEISKLGVAAGDAFTLPEEETRYALSQQMLIIKTGRLNRRRASMPQSDLTEASLNLAVEQRMIRAELVFMLGGEVQDEEVEAEQSTELQEGRLQNRGQRDLRTATIAMSQAEKLLTGANPSDALTAERAAVIALQRAFARDRYILRALTTRSQLDPARRLTGDLSAAANWRRIPPETPANHRAAQLQDLLRGLAELSSAIRPSTSSGRPELAEGRNPQSAMGDPQPARNPQSAPRQARGALISSKGATRNPQWSARAAVLAEQALRTDPASARLREAATELQRAAEPPTDAAARSRALSAAATAVALEARLAAAAAPLLSSSPAPALGGAFSDALENARAADARLKPSRYNVERPPR